MVSVNGRNTESRSEARCPSTADAGFPSESGWRGDAREVQDRGIQIEEIREGAGGSASGNLVDRTRSTDTACCVPYTLCFPAVRGFRGASPSAA